MNENYLLDLPLVCHDTEPILNPQVDNSPQVSSETSFHLQTPSDPTLSPKMEPISGTSSVLQDEPTAETENLPNSASSIPSDPALPYLDVNPASRVEGEDQSPSISSAGIPSFNDVASQEHITYRGPQNTRTTSSMHHNEEVRHPPTPIRDHTTRLRFFNTFPARRSPASDEEADDLLNKAFEGYVYLIIIYIFSILVLKKYLSFYCFLSFAIVTCVGQVASIMRNSEENRILTHRQKMMKYFQVIDWVLLTIFIFVAGCQIHLTKIPLSPFTLPGFINAILFYFFSNDGTNSLMRKSTISLLKLLFWTQILLISFKADDIIENWLLVFIELFYTLVFLMAVSVGFFIVAVCYLCKNRDSGYFDYDVVGLVWYILNAFHSWVWGLILLGLLEELRNNEDDSILIYGLIIGLVHSVVLIVFTMVFEKKILTYLSFTLQQILGNIETAPKGIATFETTKENINYLLKISPTYFLAVHKRFKLKDKQLPQTCKQQIREVKQQRRVNKNLKELACARNNSESNMEEPSTTITKLQKNKIKPRKIITENINNKTLFFENEKMDDVYYSDDDAGPLNEVQKSCNQNSDESESCVICCLNQPSAVFMSCGHGGVCHGCALEAWKNGDNCVFCRQPITKILKVTMLNRVNVARVIEGTKKSFTFSSVDDRAD